MALLNFTADNVKVSRDGSLITIASVRPENHGPYRCVASNPFGITHTIVSVIVKGKEKAQEKVCRARSAPCWLSAAAVLVSSDSPVAVVTPTGPVRVRLGEPINLECQASGEPRPSVSWHRLDSHRKTMLTSPVPMETNAVMQVRMHPTTPAAGLEIGVFNVGIFPPLKILAARAEDSGTYVCTARSSDGSTETKVEVVVEGKPRTSVPEPRVVVVEGQTATLRCHAHGKMTPSRATFARFIWVSKL